MIGLHWGLFRGRVYLATYIRKVNMKKGRYRVNGPKPLLYVSNILHDEPITFHFAYCFLYNRKPAIIPAIANFLPVRTMIFLKAPIAPW
jgi:hypothetical protein